MNDEKLAQENYRLQRILLAKENEIGKLIGEKLDLFDQLSKIMGRYMDLVRSGWGVND